MNLIIIAVFLFVPLSAFADTSDNWSYLLNVINEGKSNIQSLSKMNFSDCNLVGLELSNLDLTNVNFSGADLSGSYMYGSNLQNSVFDNAIM